uniref:DUF3311 domain-containing protein n=1 Tax=Desulfobacca acetoxidans TaxID=60893 RepID=A0A7V6A3V4_9BACT
MTKRSKILILFGILAFALFNYPLLNIFNRDLCWVGIPVLIYYFFGAWLVVVVILAVSRRFLSS